MESHSTLAFFDAAGTFVSKNFSNLFNLSNFGNQHVIKNHNVFIKTFLKHLFNDHFTFHQCSNKSDKQIDKQKCRHSSKVVNFYKVFAFLNDFGN